jgi:hemoglobin
MACGRIRWRPTAAMNDAIVYTLIGEPGFQRLVAAFYRRVAGDPILGPMYPPHEMAAAEQRLRQFLIQRFGGPAHYSEQRGHPRLRMRHMPFPIDHAARDRWVALMDQALHDVQLPEQAAKILRPFFHTTASFMINR